MHLYSRPAGRLGSINLGDFEKPDLKRHAETRSIRAPYLDHLRRAVIGLERPIRAARNGAHRLRSRSCASAIGSASTRSRPACGGTGSRCFSSGFENVEIFETDEKAPQAPSRCSPQRARGMVPASLRPLGGGERAFRQHATAFLPNKAFGPRFLIGPEGETLPKACLFFDVFRRSKRIASDCSSELPANGLIQMPKLCTVAS